MGKSENQVITRSKIIFNNGRTMKTSKTNHVLDRAFNAPALRKTPDRKAQKKHHPHRDLKQLAETENLILISSRRARVNQA